MADSISDEDSVEEKSSDHAKQVRDQSTIVFPYGDLNDAVSVAKALMKCGGVPCSPDQLAAALDQNPGSGNFRLKISTAKIFGALESAQGKYKLTDLGFALADPSKERAARASAFLTVPLYKKLYEDFRNKSLPPRPAPLEHTFVSFGVAKKQKERARQAFDRSAQQAGFFEHGNRDRLIQPIVSDDSSASNTVDPPPDPPNGGKPGGSGGGSDGTYHPFIQGLLATLPVPDSDWNVADQAKWLQTASSIFGLIYKSDGSGFVSVEVKRI